MSNFSEEAKVVLESRYLLKDKTGKVIETPDEMLRRVARHVSKAEKTSELQSAMESKFISIMDSLEFLPNSPTLMNAGKELGQLSACFLLPCEDNLSNIFETVKQAALIHKTGGGTGIVFSHLRPTKSMVASTSGVASGPVSFMRVFDVATDVVKQGGVRRGANMGVLNVSHPDIYEFIKCKESTSEFQNFNISITITDNFLRAVSNCNGYPLRNPYTKEKIYIKAAELFDLICEQAWLTGEPGLIFIDTINSRNPIPWAGKIEGTNPCITGDSLIAVADGRGAISIRQLAEEGKDVPVYCKDNEGWTHVRWGRNPRITGRNKKILKVLLDDGSYIKTTEDHKFYLKSGEKVEAIKLKINDSLMRFDRYQFSYQKKDQKYWGIKNARRNVYQEHRLITEFEMGRKLAKDEVIHHIDHDGLNNAKINRKLTNIKEHSDIHDISGIKNPMIRFPEKNIFNNHDWQIENVKKVHLGKKHSDEWNKNIGLSTLERFKDLYFREKHKKAMIRWSQEKYNHKVVSIEECGYEDVYNITVDEFHNYCVVTSNEENNQSGITVSNCGEQPLLPYESCNLGSINVSKFVKDKKIDWDRLSEVVEISVRFLDDVIDVNKYPNVKIENKTKLTRKVGLGIMGWADMLISLGIKYDSDQAIKTAKKLMMNIRETAHIASRELGKEKGHCFSKLKRRNSTLTTIAPTGTLSILSDCSSGIEPVFGKKFTKTVLNGVKLDLGKKYQGIDEKVLITALDVPVEKHIEMQAAFQMYTDNAVSKTVNLPSDSTKEDVKKAFLLAHELGCKGITVYRDGSRKAPIEISVEGSLSECEGNRCQI